MMALVGLPPFPGFWAKWQLVMLLAGNDMYAWIALILIGSLLALVYVWRLIEAAYFGTAVAGAEQVREAPASMLIPVWLLVAANFYFGINTDISVGTAMQSAAALMGAGG